METCARVWFDERDCADADQEGIGHFDTGFNVLSEKQAEAIIGKYEGALLGKHYAAKKKRLIAQRNAIVSAFGYEMSQRVGWYK